MPTSPSSALTCPSCGTPHSPALAADLAATLEETAATLSSHSVSTRPPAVVVLCPSCADAAQIPSSLRTFRVSLIIEEQVPAPTPPPGTSYVTPAPDAFSDVAAGAVMVSTDGTPVNPPVTAWETVGRFAVTGTGQSVRNFAETTADEFASRLQTLIGLADAPTADSPLVADPDHPTPPGIIVESPPPPIG